MVEPTSRLAAALADRYRLERELGQGGMATVYLAEDLKHRRQVALKLLRPELSSLIGPERFLKEIEVTASLQHPHILPLHDSGSADGLLFYVMPYVAGESLRQKLTREKQLGVEEAVRITTQVASALDYAHRRNVIHRDIKPENILLHEGQALLADFGIALALRQAGGERITETGLSLGTPQYMSPEQAAGDRELDARSDVYSLGCVLYEMLAGEPPHTGPTVQAVIARVMHEEPRALSLARKTIPPHVEAAVRQAMAKLPADRFAGAAAFAAALANPGFTASAGTGGRAKRRRAAMPGIGAVVALALFLLLGIFLGRGTASGGPVTYDVALPDSAPIWFTGGSPWGEGWTALAVSPSGDFVVYVARRDTATELWYRSLLDTVARPIAGTRGAYYPMLSPDGERVAFFSGNQLQVMPLAGGTALALGEVDRPHGARWKSANQIWVSDRNSTSLRVFDPAARTSRAIASGPCFIPDALAEGRVLCGYREWPAAVVATVDTLDHADSQFLRLRSGGTADTAALLAGTDFRQLDRSLITFMSLDGALSAAEVDLLHLRAEAPVTVIPGVRREGFNGPGQYAVSPSGTLVYVPGDNAEIGAFVRLREGVEPEELPIPPAVHHRFDLSRNGSRLATALYGPDGMELWSYELATGRGERWLRGLYIGEPRWDPRGERLMVSILGRAGAKGVAVFGAPESSTGPDTLFDGQQDFEPFSWFADSLLLGDLVGASSTSARLDLRSNPPRVDSFPSERDQFLSTLSPDGRWLAYNGTSTGKWDVYLERFPGDGRRYKVSPAGGVEPLWRDARHLVFRSGVTWYEATVNPANSRPVGEPRLLFSDPRFLDTRGRSNVMAPDGSIIYLRGTDQTTRTFLRVVPRFADLVRRRVREVRQ